MLDVELFFFRVILFLLNGDMPEFLNRTRRIEPISWFFNTMASTMKDSRQRKKTKASFLLDALNHVNLFFWKKLA